MPDLAGLPDPLLHMKTWKSKFFVCRSSKSGKFAGKKKCGMFKRTKVRRSKAGFLFS